MSEPTGEAYRILKGFSTLGTLTGIYPAGHPLVTDKVRESALRMGVRRILEKPVDIDKLRSAIREAIPMPRSAGTGC